ncbi:hypothetical protein PF008_g20532 [Phytophthora fragariae]|uniref:Uncharacterized protein n=1 Tax=Phytophthora fragariae TaxID=53985 RepID=A0A6G0QZ91_9STRA|nr:hypothetical protein PF008_g20532 [Phytophthora fragariae]
MSYKDIALWAVKEFTLPTVPAKATIHNILHAKSKLLGRSAKDPMDPKSSQSAPTAPGHHTSKKVKGRAKAKAKQTRMKWTNVMVEKLLKIRFQKTAR